MRVISVVNQKGGCGKTTVAIHLASALSGLGARVLLVDNDPQGHASLGLGCDVSALSLTTRDLYLTSDMRVQDLRVTVGAGLDLVPAAIDLAGVEAELASDPDRLERLDAALADSEMPYDLVIIDNPPHVGLLTFNALLASGEVLAPVDPGRFTLEAVSRLRATLDLLAEEREHPLHLHLVANGFDLRTRHARDLLERLAMEFPESLLDARIHRTVRLREAVDQGVPIEQLDPRSRARQDFEELATELWALPPELMENDRSPTRSQVTVLEPQEAGRWNQLLHGEDGRSVRLRVDLPEAETVAVTGDFTNWSIEGRPLRRDEDGGWFVDLELEPGVYEYKFIVDGVWRTDPTHDDRVRNSYGQLNSVLRVLDAQV